MPWGSDAESPAALPSSINLSERSQAMIGPPSLKGVYSVLGLKRWSTVADVVLAVEQTLLVHSRLPPRLSKAITFLATAVPHSRLDVIRTTLLGDELAHSSQVIYHSFGLSPPANGFSEEDDEWDAWATAPSAFLAATGSDCATAWTSTDVGVQGSERDSIPLELHPSPGIPSHDLAPLVPKLIAEIVQLEDEIELAKTALELWTRAAESYERTPPSGSSRKTRRTLSGVAPQPPPPPNLLETATQTSGSPIKSRVKYHTQTDPDLSPERLELLGLRALSLLGRAAQVLGGAVEGGGAAVQGHAGDEGGGPRAVEVDGPGTPTASRGPRVRTRRKGQGVGGLGEEAS